MRRRGVTSVQIARATEAERAEARSLSADRRHKLRLDLGESEGVSKLLENSLLGAEGACAALKPPAHELIMNALQFPGISTPDIVSLSLGPREVGVTATPQRHFTLRAGLRPGALDGPEQSPVFLMCWWLVCVSRWTARRCGGRGRHRRHVAPIFAAAAADHLWRHSRLHRGTLRCILRPHLFCASAPLFAVHPEYPEHALSQAVL